jgi:hypothetical protein
MSAGRDEGGPQAPAHEELVTVTVVGFPLRIYAAANEHMEELRREFALLTMRPPEDGVHEVPRRLLDLVAALTERYTGMTASPDAARDIALAEGKESVDLIYQVPKSVAQAARELDVMLDEADEYCRSGEHLLTLATPAEPLLFRRWYLYQFVDQIELGAPPQPWPEFRRRADGSPV